ncbi:MAG: phosphatase PAP2 family protein [bacterium]
MGIVGCATVGETLKRLRSQRDLMRAAAYSGGAALALTLYIAWHGTPAPGDIDVITWFQDIGFFSNNASWVNALGTFEWQALSLAVALLCAALGPRLGLHGGSVGERTAAVWAFVLAFALRMFSTPLKEMAQANRPSLDFHVRVTADFPGYGFPSGHVFSDVLVFGAIAVFAPRLIGAGAGAAVRVACVAVLVLAGPARMAVGAHWPSDVLGGYLWGIAALCVAVAGGRRLAGQR